MSYVALIEVAKEIWALSARVERVTSVSEVMALAQKQARRQERFVLAYGPDFVRPKHHHRLHLPSDVLKLGFVPNCSCMERKHQELKSGKIMDGLARWVNQGMEMQNHALSELLLRGAQAPGPWNSKLLNATSSASLDAKRHFRDESLKRASSGQGCCHVSPRGRRDHVGMRRRTKVDSFLNWYVHRLYSPTRARRSTDPLQPHCVGLDLDAARIASWHLVACRWTRTVAASGVVARQRKLCMVRPLTGLLIVCMFAAEFV